MPGFYTHARFGKKVFETLNMELKQKISEYEDLFYIGLQGPDILFYHKAYIGNEISKKGFAQHGQPGKVFFEPAREIIRNCENTDAAFSYLAGFVCHFTLDSQCHPYIATVEEDTKLSHAEIETEVERYLMELDGRDSLRHLEVNNVVISDFNTEVISLFFGGVESHDVRRALRDMKFFSGMFCAPGKIKRNMVNLALKVAGQYDSMAGMIVNYEENPACYESTRKIAQLSQEAVELACQLIEQYEVAIEKCEMPLHARYEKTFGVE